MKYPTLQACHAKHRRRDFPPPALSRCGEPSATRATREASERGEKNNQQSYWHYRYIIYYQMRYIIPIYTGWWFQPQYSQYMEKSKCSKPPTSIYIYIIPNKLINNQQPLIINILIPIYWEYLQRTICIPICASHSLSLSPSVKTAQWVITSSYFGISMQ